MTLRHHHGHVHHSENRDLEDSRLWDESMSHVSEPCQGVFGQRTLGSIVLALWNSVQASIGSR